MTFSLSLSMVGDEVFPFRQNFVEDIEQSIVGGGNPGVVDVPTTGTVIDLGDISVQGWGWFQNLGQTDIHVGLQAASALQPFATIKPGHAFPMPLYSSVTLMAQAVSTSGRLLVYVLEA